MAYVKYLLDTKLFDKDGIGSFEVLIRFFFRYGTNPSGSSDLFTLSACFSEFICCKYINERY